MGVSFGGSRVADLSFQVVNRAIHPEWLTVRSHSLVEREPWRADLRIIQGGHAVHWCYCGLRVTEVLAGPETPLPEVGLLLDSSIRHDRATKLQVSPRLEYQVCLGVERVDTGLFRRLSEEFYLDRRQTDLLHQYSPNNRLSPGPLCHVRFESRPKSLSIHTIHTFPDELAIVRTQSLFEIVGPVD